MHSRARPTASAARITRARSTSVRRAPGSTVAGAPSRVTRAVRRVGSMLGGVSTVTPPRRPRPRPRRRRPPPGAAAARPPPSTAPAEPGRGAAVDGDRAAQRDRAGHRAVGQAGQVGLGGLAAHRGQHGAGDHRGHERARRHRPAQLLDDDDQLLEAVARAAVLLGDVQPEPAQAHQVVPERRQRLVGRLEQRPGGAAGVPLGRKSEAVPARARWSSVMAIDMAAPYVPWSRSCW